MQYTSRSPFTSEASWAVNVASPGLSAETAQILSFLIIFVLLIVCSNRSRRGVKTPSCNTVRTNATWRTNLNFCTSRKYSNKQRQRFQIVQIVRTYGEHNLQDMLCTKVAYNLSHSTNMVYANTPTFLFSPLYNCISKTSVTSREKVLVSE
jgi:hypothetical protein